jgi:hypothetical protein
MNPLHPAQHLAVLVGAVRVMVTAPMQARLVRIGIRSKPSCGVLNLDDG